MSDAELRELDAQVAEKVMGVIWDDMRCRVCGWSLSDRSENGCTKKSCSLRPVPDRRADLPAPYSSSISAAMSVVEKMQDTHDVEIGGAAGGGWFVSFEPNCHPNAGAGGPDLAECICRAALAAVVETEE